MVARHKDTTDGEGYSRKEFEEYKRQTDRRIDELRSLVFRVELALAGMTMAVVGLLGAVIASLVK